MMKFLFKVLAED